MLVIGRRPDCDVALPDRTVSRTHAVIMLFGGRWYVMDHGSTNGTRLNGRLIRGARVVHPGDTVSFGRVTLRLTAA